MGKQASERNFLADDGRFRVFCKIAKKEMKEEEARGLYQAMIIGGSKDITEIICSASCGLKCYSN